MREGWKVELFDSEAELDEATRKENLARTPNERLRILTELSSPGLRAERELFDLNPNADRPQSRLSGPYQIIDVTEPRLTDRE